MLTPAGREPLTVEEADHCERVGARLRAIVVQAGGWIPFSQFMQFALYEPDLGYYATGRVGFGPAGDFVTAPELSPLFARCLARQVAEVLERTGGGDVVEYGAGSGRLALDLLAAAGKVQSYGRGRARRWMTPPVPGVPTILLLPGPLPSD